MQQLYHIELHVAWDTDKNQQSPEAEVHRPR